MKGKHLGEFEELMLLMVGILFNEAYGVALKEAFEEHTGRSVKISAVHSALHRLQEKGYLRSRWGGATQERGGRRKRYFELTESGKAVLRERHQLRNQLWSKLPNFGTLGFQ